MILFTGNSNRGLITLAIVGSLNVIAMAQDNIVSENIQKTLGKLQYEDNKNGWIIPNKPAPCPWNTIIGGCVGPSIDMNAIVNYRVNGILYGIPAAYLTTWPTAAEIATVQSNDIGGLPDFAFWMPSRRPEFIKTAPPMVLPAIRERGGTWAIDEYPVTVLAPQFVGPNDHDVILPEAKFRNLASVTSGSGDKYTEEFGAERFKFEKDPFGFINYRQINGQNPQFMIRCSNNDMPYPGCDGYVYYNDTKLYYYLRYPADKMKDWQIIFDTARALIYGWRVPN